MLSWKPWQGTAAEWDAQIVRFPDYTVYQGHAWGEHKGRFGWVAYRLVAMDGDRCVAAAQVLVRRFPLGIGLVWVPGGPLGAVDAWGDGFRTAIRQVADLRILYCRVNAMRERVEGDVEALQRHRWKTPHAAILSGMSLSYLPEKDEAVRVSRASSNWRHNWRRSQKYGHKLSVWQNPDPDELLAVYQAMQSHKQLAEQFSRPELVSLLEVFGDRCVLVRCDDAEGRLLAVRGALLLGDKAWDMFAAATPEARKVYASHAAFCELMGQCAERGVRWYDMSGADPVGNKGVYDFKKGAGAEDLRYLGEWDWASFAVLRWAVNQAIQRRRGM